MNKPPDKTPLDKEPDTKAQKGGEQKNAKPFSFSFQKLPDEVFDKVSAFVEEELGIKMPYKKKTMLEARLRKRLRHLGMDSFEEYADYVFSEKGHKEEIFNMIDVVTTNKTDFFREPKHFDYLMQTVLPESLRAHPNRPFNLWSAGCSTGEEPYTLAIVLSEYARKNSGFPFSILATDVSTDVLYSAHEGIYKEARITHVEEEIKKRYFLRSRDRYKKLVRVALSIREKVLFKRINFMVDDYKIKDMMDAVFFRNVMIYFDMPTKEAIVNRLCRHIRKGGYLFVGHSETLLGMSAPLEQTKTSAVYRKI